MDDVTGYEITAVPAVARGTFRFDQVRYDADADVLHLSSGPDAASVTERSPEGFLLRIDPLENRVIGVEIDSARARTLSAGSDTIKITIGPGHRLGFDPADLRRIVFGGRFSRTEMIDLDALDKAAAAKPRFAR